MNRTTIVTTKTVYPQIYAYVLPGYAKNEGWIKIGYTQRQDVKQRIAEQTRTAQIDFDLLWAYPALYINSGEWFTDKPLHAYLEKFKEIKRNPNTEWFYYDGTPEKALDDFNDFRHQRFNQRFKSTLDYQLRAEQEEAVATTLKYMKKHPGGEFLWNAKPRFGKTLSTYDLVRRIQAKNVLIVTNRPSIANSWFDDFDTFIEGKEPAFCFVSTTDSLKERSVLTREQFIDQLSNYKDGYPGCIAFISLQDLKGALSFGGEYDKLEWVKGLTWDLLVIDEAHEGVETFKTDLAFDNISRNFTLHLSGTPFKAIAQGRFNQDQIYNWTYADEQNAKANWAISTEQENPYENLPQLNLFSYQISPMITDQVNQGAQIDGQEMDFAFDLNEFFSTNDRGNFVHLAEVNKWLDTLSRNEKYPFSTTELRNELKHTLWLLKRVSSAKALEKLLKAHPVFENYKIVLAAGDGKTEDDSDISQKSFNRVREAIQNNEKTITLSVGQLTTGVTIPEWTGVLILSDMKSASLYMQAAFRPQNPWSYVDKGNVFCKKNAYVFDFAPERTLILYDQFANDLYSKTAGGSGTTTDRETNIRQLLNFFPVIAEDSAGKMVELDVKQVLTIPHTIKAQEVVKRGFMSNLLFQNISGVFSNSEVREILQQLNPVAPGKLTPSQNGGEIDTKNVVLNDAGEVVPDAEIVIAETEARFGDKVYAHFSQALSEADEPTLAHFASKQFSHLTLPGAEQLAKENDISATQARKIVQQNADELLREMQKVEQQAEITRNEAQRDYNRQVTQAQNDPIAVQQAKERFDAAQRQIEQGLKKEIEEKAKEKIQELTQKNTEDILKKKGEKNKSIIEDDVRARLRGFARTIPSFLMAYGQPDTTLANFDQHISDAVFHEVTGITLDQFRTLRDKYNFFIPTVFDESVQEFLHKKEALANYFDSAQTEDIFDYIPPQKTNQIFTPRDVVTMMLNNMEEEDPDLFTDKNRTFADLYVKSGLYLTEIVKRLFVGLETAIPNEQERLKHILEHQIYGFAPSEIIYRIAKNFIFGNFTAINDSHLQCRDLTETAKQGDNLDMKFDVVVGNPPYQDENVGEHNQPEPIYHLFYDLAKQISPRYCLISPARFLSKAGDTPKEWNESMLKDPHIKMLLFEQNSAKLFPNTDIKGGVVILFRDQNIRFGEIGTFTTYIELHSILVKVSKKTIKTIDTIITGSKAYKLNEQALQEYPHIVDFQPQWSKFVIATNAFKRLDTIIYFETKPDDGKEYVQLLGLLNAQRVYRYIRRDFINAPNSFLNYKVILPNANGSGAIGEVLSTPLIGEPLIGEPLIGYTDTFMSIGEFDNELEAQNCLKYIKSKFARTMLGILKVTQHNSPATWSKVPLPDFTSGSDIDWEQSIPDIDRQLYAKYGLTPKEIAFIEEKVRPME